MDIGTWGETAAANGRSDERKDGKSGGGGAPPRNAWGATTPAAPRQSGGPGGGGGGVKSSNSGGDAVNGPATNGKGFSSAVNNGPPNHHHGGGGGTAGGEEQTVPTVLKELMVTHKYNPKDYNLSPRNARFFVIKSYSEDDIHRSIKYGIWCSTEHGNKRLDDAFRTQESKGPVLLFFSVNGSGHFCGMAQMMGHVDYDTSSRVWLQDKWKGQFQVKWVYVKDVPNSQLRHIRLENNENKPVTNSRDTQEILGEKGKQVLKIIHTYKHSTSIFDDFGHYEKRQEVETFRDNDVVVVVGSGSGMSAGGKPSAPPSNNNNNNNNNQPRK